MKGTAELTPDPSLRVDNDTSPIPVAFEVKLEKAWVTFDLGHYKDFETEP